MCIRDSEVGVHLDWRSVPGERIEEACALVEALGREAAEPGICLLYTSRCV